MDFGQKGRRGPCRDYCSISRRDADIALSEVILDRREKEVHESSGVDSGKKRRSCPYEVLGIIMRRKRRSSPWKGFSLFL
jgi:hypothetical protein